MCFWEEILGREWAGWEGDASVSAGSAQPPADNSAELQTKTPSLEQHLARSWCWWVRENLFKHQILSKSCELQAFSLLFHVSGDFCVEEWLCCSPWVQ